MKPNFVSFRRSAAILGQLVVLALLSFNGNVARADDAPANVATSDATSATASTDDAEKAWRQVRRASQSPMPPAEWQDKEPTHEEVAKFYTTALLKGADTAKDFYTKYPDNAKAADARKIEYDMLSIATEHFGYADSDGRLAGLTAKRMADPSLSEDEKFDLRFKAAKQLLGDMPKNTDDLLKAARALEKDFPKHDEGYQLMLMVLTSSEGDKAQALAKEIVDSSAPDQIKAEAKGVLKRLDAVGKPVDIQYTAVDGRDVNVANMKGKVVLVDFWATWCGPCMGEVPNVKATYAKLHDKGFEIVGISFDQDKDALNKTLKEKEMTWPQYFDGEGWKNKFGQEFGINSIPTMWLVDKKGNLRDVNGRENLEDKVAKMLAEQ